MASMASTVGDEVEVFVDRVENANGEAMLSRDRARREASWDALETQYAAGERVEGVIFGRVKGGFTVDLNGAVAFLPGSQVDIRPVRDVTPLMNLPQPFQILKMDRKRGNIVVSRRSILEESRAEQRSGLILSLAEGQIVDGTVKNITDYGAFVDLGGIDGLLHVTDMSYKRVNHPSEVLQHRRRAARPDRPHQPRNAAHFSLGMKQLEADPWTTAAAEICGRFSKPQGPCYQYHRIWRLRRTRSPASKAWCTFPKCRGSRRTSTPARSFRPRQEVEVIVLEVDEEKRRISLGLKQAQRNPWEVFAEEHAGWFSHDRRRSQEQPPNSACSSASMAKSMAWSICRTLPGA